MACYYMIIPPEAERRAVRLIRHILRGGWGRKNSKQARKALKLTKLLGYKVTRFKYARGLHRSLREAIADCRKETEECSRTQYMSTGFSVAYGYGSLDA